MGVQKFDARPKMMLGGFDRVVPVTTHGSTSGSLTAGNVNIITATATGLVYQLPAPKAGQPTWVSVDYTGATGNLTLANASTGTVFNGSTANVITAASSDVHLSVMLMGLTTARFMAWTSTGSGVSFAGSTVTS